MNGRAYGAGWFAVGAVALASLVTPSLAAAQDARRPLDLPAGDLDDALRGLGEASGAQLLFSPELVRGLRAPALRGTYSTRQALDRLLADTGLTHRRTAAGVVMIVRRAAAPPPVLAPRPPPTPPAPREQTADLDEVVVASGKRAENIQKVPASVLVATAATMERAGVRDFDDLIKIVPSLTITKTTQPGNNSINIRGVGTYAYSIATEPSVVVVIDDVPQVFQAAAFTALTDVQQVEVLRGPQNTLFGKSASAGVIYVTTRPASETFGARFETLVTDDHEHRVQASITGPITGDLAGRLTLSHSRYRGNVHNLTTGQWLNGQSDTHLRAKLTWTPTSEWTATLSPYVTRTLASCCVGAEVEVSPTATYGKIELARARILRDIVPGPNNREVRLDVNARGNMFNYGTGLKVVRRFGDHALTAISGYDRNYLYDRQDTDGSDFDFSTVLPQAPKGGSANGGYFKFNSISQELRLTSPEDGRLRYVAGGFYNRTSARRYFVRGSNTLGDYNGLDALPTTHSTAYSRYRAHAVSVNMAVFGQGSYALTDRLDLLGGLRLNREKVSYTFNDLGSGLSYGEDGCVSQRGPLTIRTCDRDTVLTGRAGAQYAWSPDVMLFAVHSRGHKGAAFDLSSSLTTRGTVSSGPFAGLPTADTVAAQQPVAPEEVVNNEIGFKASLADHRVIWNLTLYREVFQGFQTQSRDRLTGLNVLNSVGKATSEGVETEFSARLGERLSLNGAGAYSRAIMKQFRNANCYGGQTAAEGCVGGQQDLSGKPLFNAPRWKFNLNALYEAPLAERWTGFATAGWRWQSKVNHSLLQDPDSVQKAYGVLDLSAGVRNARWSAAVFVNNLFDQSFAITRGRDVWWNVSPGGNPPTNAVQWKPARESQRHIGLHLAVNY